MQVAPYIVGLTGGIGSGKTTVSDLFAALGAHVVDTDVISRALTASGGVALPAICKVFGEGILTQEGALNRVSMREKVFCDASARSQLEAILHPLIFEESVRQCAQTPAGTYALLVVPLWVENSRYAHLADRLCVVDTSEAIQLARVRERSGLDASSAKRVLVAQASRADRLAVADDVIDNSGDLDALKKQVKQLHVCYLTAACQRQTVA